MKIYLDGKFVDEADAKISVFDHGLLYGDGVFEGIRLYGGNIFRLEEHLERLEYSAKAILLKLPLTRKELSEVTCETCRQNNLTDAYIRLVVTRGVGDLGLAPWLCPKPTVFVIASRIIFAVSSSGFLPSSSSTAFSDAASASAAGSLAVSDTE